MIVVILESITVRKECLPPALTADMMLFPLRISSLIRSFVIMLASTAIPTPSINAATPGKVNVKSALSNTHINNHVCTIRANAANKPGTRYITTINMIINTDAIKPASIVCCRDCLPSVAPTLCEYFSVNFSGSAPRLISSRRSFASSRSPPTLIDAVPSVSTACTTGAEINLSFM
ncbi:hypothetical protein D3C76_968730 [compost metagenome]